MKTKKALRLARNIIFFSVLFLGIFSCTKIVTLDRDEYLEYPDHRISSVVTEDNIEHVFIDTIIVVSSESGEPGMRTIRSGALIGNNIVGVQEDSIQVSINLSDVSSINIEKEKSEAEFIAVVQRDLEYYLLYAMVGVLLTALVLTNI